MSVSVRKQKAIFKRKIFDVVQDLKRCCGESTDKNRRHISEDVS